MTERLSRACPRPNGPTTSLSTLPEDASTFQVATGGSLFSSKTRRTNTNCWQGSRALRAQRPACSFPGSAASSWRYRRATRKRKQRCSCIKSNRKVVLVRGRQRPRLANGSRWRGEISMTMDNAQSKKSMVPRIFAAALLLLFVPLTQSAAQEAGGTIVGTVTDTSGAVVADAAVTIKNAATGLGRSSTTNADGLYS